MTHSTIAGGLLVSALVVSAAVLVFRAPVPAQRDQPAATSPPPNAGEIHPGFLYGRIAVDGVTYEGRLRWGGTQEAFWGDFFDGVKAGNPWAVHAPRERNRLSLEVFGVAIGGRDFPRPFMARFGDIARIEAQFSRVQVTLKSGTVFDLDRFGPGDIDDGVRVWDNRRGVVDVNTRQIRTIEFLQPRPIHDAPVRLHGTVRTRLGAFTGFIEWDQEDGVDADELRGRSGTGERIVRYDTVRSMARHSRDSVLVTLLDGREVVLSGNREIGHTNRGIYVDDRRYGRVLVSWDAFERLEFSPSDSGPGYDDFPPGRPISGTIVTRDGRRLAGRLVYDFDESETTETFEVSRDGVDYYIPVGLIASILTRDQGGDPQRPSVMLHDGEVLPVQRSGDLGPRHDGMLVFIDGRTRPEYVRWSDVDQVQFDRPAKR